MSGGEVLLLLLIGIAAFGGRRLPEAQRWLGRGLRHFHRARNELRDAVGGDAGPAPLPPARPRDSRLID